MRFRLPLLAQLRAASAAFFVIGAGAAQADLPASVVEMLKTEYANMGQHDIRVSLVSGESPCDDPFASLPRKANERGGRVSVSVMCTEGLRYMQVQVDVHQGVVAASRGLEKGHVIADNDMIIRPVILSDHPRTVITEKGEIKGMILVHDVTENQPLTKNMLKINNVVKRNDPLQVSASGDGFTLMSQGVALENGGVGQVIRVGMGNRKSIQAKVIESGVVEANF